MKPKMDKPPVLNLTYISKLILSEDKNEFDLSKYKILGKGSITKAVTVKALSFSKLAEEKIKKAGGKTETLYAPKTEPEGEERDQAAGNGDQDNKS
jgi:ribosomal protein L18E